jgi:hypothetical protein
MRQNNFGSQIEDCILRNNTFKEGNTFEKGLVVGEAGDDRAEILGLHLSEVVAVAVPSITDPDIAKVDVTVTDNFDVSVKVGDVVQAIPQEALPTNARLQSAYVSADNTVTLVFGSEGGNVTGANKNFKFLVTKLVP